MRVALSARGQGLDDRTDPVFGRCPFFVFVDSETLDFESVENGGARAAGGAGIEAAQLIARHLVDAVVTGDVGPNAIRVLRAAGIRVFTGALGTVREAIGELAAGDLPETVAETVRGHSGSGRGA